MTPDPELLANFARTNSGDDFAELVRRHVNLVYSAALRQVNGDVHLAQDVAQTVFADLARRAASLSRRQSLSGWLYTSAHFAAAKIVRTESRRREREERFMREPINESASETDWEKIRPALDDAMHELKDGDREAILLRYFENRPFAEVGARLGLNENAARMRVERALEKLRASFSRRGVTTTATLAAAISANAVQLAPAGLATTLTATSTVAAGTGAFTFLKIMTATQMKLGFSAVVVACMAGALVVQHQAQVNLAGDNQALQRQIDKLHNDLSKTTNAITVAAGPLPLAKEQLTELLKLRGEVGVLRRELEMQKSWASQAVGNSNGPVPLRKARNSFIARDEINDAGFDTPEAALQTWMHGILTGDYEAVTNAMMGQIQTDIAQDSKQEEDFKKAFAQGVMTNFLGEEVIAKKILSDDKVELEMLVFQDGAAPDISIQRMVKEGDQWKFAGSIAVTSSWGKDGQVQSCAPLASQ